jgi:hypothetical protein
MSTENSGYIYILFNEVFKYYYSENVFKLGKTNDITHRITGYTTSYIEPVEIKYLSTNVKNYTLAEQKIFKLLKENRIKNNREFFKLDTIQIAINVIETVVDKINDMADDEIQDVLLLNKKQKLKERNYNYRKLQNKIMIEKFKISYPDENDEVITKQLINLYQYCYCSKICSNNKINLIREFEEINELDSFCNDVNSVKMFVLPNELYDKIKLAFQKIDKKPETFYEFKKFYFSLLKNIFGGLGMIESKRVRKG